VEEGRGRQAGNKMDYNKMKEKGGKKGGGNTSLERDRT
jgi:hypothetical protein